MTTQRIRGNTGELYQAIAISASQLAGPIFDNATGTLEERLRHCIDHPQEHGVTLCKMRLERLQGLIDVSRSEEV